MVVMKRVAQHTGRAATVASDLKLSSYASEHIQLITANIAFVYSELMTGGIANRLYISFQKTASF
jgi:hypothetical protein